MASQDDVPLPTSLLSTAYDLSAAALAAWGVEDQRTVIFEELGELVTAVAQHRRGRVSSEDVLTEAADAIIMATASAAIIGCTAADLEAAIRAKMDRLKSRLAEHDRKEQQAAIAALNEGRKEPDPLEGAWDLFERGDRV